MIPETSVEQSGSRMRLLAYIVKHPGQWGKEITRATGQGEGGTQYHLYVLEYHGYIRREKHGKKVLYYPTYRGQAVGN